MPTGLPNLGATCFVNALVQALRVTLHGIALPADDASAPFVAAMVQAQPQRFIAQVRANAKDKGFASLMHAESQDTQELFLLWTELVPALAQYLQLSVAEIIVCQHCGHRRTRLLPAQHCIEIPAEGAAAPAARLADAVRQFFQEEALQGGTCDRCTTRPVALRRCFKFRKPVGRLLCFHLAWQRENSVVFPTTLKLNGCAYELVSIVCHPPGHYCAFVKDASQWYLCDDGSVRAVTEAEAMRYRRLASQIFYRQLK